MRHLGRNLHKLTETIIDLPQDVFTGLPRITMIGNVQMYIENHRGVLFFSSELLRLALNKGELQVSGSELVIRAIGQEEVFLEGSIFGFKYIHG